MQENYACTQHFRKAHLLVLKHACVPISEHSHWALYLCMRVEVLKHCLHSVVIATVLYN